MNRATLAIAGIVAMSCGPKKWRATPEQMSPLAPIPMPPTTIGPLALETAPPPSSSSNSLALRRLTEDRYLDKPRIRDESRQFLEIVETFYKPLTSETKIGVGQVRDLVGMLERLAPYSMYSVTQAYQQSSQRLNLCIRNPGLMASCDRDRAHTPRPTSTTAYEIRTAEPGIPLLVVHDLSDAAGTQWRDFTTEANRALADARGLIIDLRDASGSDPRPLLPFVAKLANRTELRPLRAIERPAAADRYVAAYEAKFTDRGRDAAVWRTLVGESTPATRPPTRAITVLVGRYCHSACEVIARSLATYANATVIGGVPRAGRAAHDERALLYLPHSQTSVYFHTTRYLFAAEIEAATGPTEEWSALVAGDGFDDVVVTTPSSPSPFKSQFEFAVRDVKYRIDHPEGWPRCDALPTTKQVQAMHCPGRASIRVSSNAPASVVRRFLATCSPPVNASSYLAGQLSIGSGPSNPALLSQIASSELVTHVSVECEVQHHINKND